MQVAVSFVTAVAGGVSASIAMMGYFAYRLNAIERLGFALAAVLFLSSDWRYDALAVLIAVALILWNLRTGPSYVTTTTKTEPTQKGDIQ